MSYVSCFTGVCNQCGSCCQYETPVGLVRCGYLIWHDALELIGTPGATECAMHALRVDAMPIPMYAVRSGDFYGWRRCAKDSPEEDAVIAARGIGRGCSLVERHG